MGHYMDRVNEVRHDRCESTRKGVRCDYCPHHAGFHMGMDAKNQRHAWAQKAVLKKGQRVKLRGGSAGYAIVQWVGANRGGCISVLVRWKETSHLDLFDQGRLILMTKAFPV